MDREPRSRRRASSAPPPRRPAASAPPRPAGAPRQPNPQRPGYHPATGATARTRRVTRAERQRQRRRRALAGLFLVAVALTAGIILSVNLLFKVTAFRVENIDRTVPADTGIYSEQQLIDLLGVQVGDNLFGFSGRAKTRELAAQLPYLDEVQVRVSLPGTVIIRVKPARERFAIPLASGWLVLSDGMKILRSSDTMPDGAIWLEANLPPDLAVLPGQYVTLAPFEAPDPAATAENADPSANALLQELMDGLETQGLLDGVSVITMTDRNELSFLYQGRVSVRLGTANNLTDKLYFAAAAILDVDGRGLGASDRGTLDVSYQRSDGEIWAYFRPAEAAPEAAPAEESAEPPPEEGGEG